MPSVKDYGYAVRLLILGMAILFLDFVTKAYVYHVLPLECNHAGFSMAAFPVFRNVLGIDFGLVLTFNHGAAWGLFSRFQIPLLIVRILVILALFIYLFFITKNRALNLPLVLILAGALGNVIDFFLYGSVVDFLQFNFWGYAYPAFNLADSAITIGVVWLLGITLYTSFKKRA